MNMEDHENVLQTELVENREEFRLIWVDENVENLKNNENILLRLNPSAQLYIDYDKFIDSMELIKNEQILLIISGTLAEKSLIKLTNYQSIIAIFIFCDNREAYLPLKSRYHKIIDVFIDQNSLFRSICQTIKLLSRHIMTFTSFEQKCKSSRDLSQQSPSFVWYQMIIYVLKQMSHDEQSKNDLIEKCKEYYQFNQNEINNIKDFEEKYDPNDAIKWYTKESFLYKLLNKSFRTEDILCIYSFRYFIIDLSLRIEEKHSKLQNSSNFTVYRGQKISIEELNKWKSNINQIISMNSFFSTSRDKFLSLQFAGNVDINDHFVSILFEIVVNPSHKTVIWADITNESTKKNEQEILFNLNCIFKILSVYFDLTFQVWKIELITTDELNLNIDESLRYVKQEMSNCSPMIYFGNIILNQLGQVDQAHKYFQILHRSLPSDHPEISFVYNGFGGIYSEKNDLDLALQNYKKALEIRLERLPANHSQVAVELHNIGAIHKRKTNFDLALVYFQRALDIEEINLPDDSLRKATIVQSIGTTYLDKAQFDSALNHLSRALEMFQHILPPKHSKISTCLGNIGLVYEKMNHLEKALEYYLEEYGMDQFCLPFDHQHLSIDLKKIVITYKKTNQMDKALQFCQNNLEEQKKHFSDNHIRIAQTLIILAKLIEEENLQEALKYYEEARSNLRKSTPIDYLTIAKCFTYTGRLYGMNKLFPRALSYHHQALQLYQELLSPNHIDIATVCRNLALCYQKTNERSEAFSHFNKSLRIYQNNYGNEHPIVKSVQDDIDKLNDEQSITSPVQEDVNDDELITVKITDDSHPCSNKELPPPPDHSTSIPSLNKTPIKPKHKCSNCQIL